MSAPAIHSVGPPPERHAARVVTEMVRWLASEEHKLEVAGARTLKLGLNYGLGNPKAQARFEKRLQASPGLLKASVVRGTRGRYGIRLLYWVVLGPGGQELVEGQLPPEKCWLAAGYQEVWPKRPERDLSAYIVFLTHHAMQRLAERCAARTTGDLLAALGEIALAMFAAAPAAVEAGIAEDATIQIGFTGGVAVVEHIPRLGWVVKTALPPGDPDASDN